MENFSLLTISGPRLPSCTMKSVRDLPPPSGTLSRPACVPCDVQSGEPLRHSCTIYRPWFSPYSYFVCTHKASPPEPCSLPDTLAASARDAGRHDELPESICSSSCSLEQARPPEGARRASPGPETRDCITSRDILLAAQQQPALHNGYKCVACCRVFPTLHSLKTHIKCGSKEGFSCQVYYYKLKALWAKEGPVWPSDRLPSPTAEHPSEQSRLADEQPPAVAARGQRGAPRALWPNSNKADK
ncbi:spermatogenesis-associated protein 46 [Emydura macquarii macquarii]|uniref:spermatogenesis-associated protein 46 n=1 Tax=Emydura macquarii macquarii TaxID=1129001 RepID=UPI00352B05E5